MNWKEAGLQVDELALFVFHCEKRGVFGRKTIRGLWWFDLFARNSELCRDLLVQFSLNFG